MSFRKLVFLSALVIFGVAGAAEAQVGIYGTYTGTDVTGITCVDPGGVCSSPNGSVKPFGAAGGIYYDFRTLGPVRLGLDLRGELLHANKSAASSTGGDGATRSHAAMAGIRGSFKTPISYLRPYGEVAMGWTSSNATEPSCQTNIGATLLCAGPVTTANPLRFDNFLRYEAFAGLDVRVFPIMDVRVVELGIGGMDRVGSGTGAGSLGVKSVSAGLVFHLP